MSDLTAPNNQQNQPYWADLRYSETLAQKLSVLHELDMSLSASPMVSLKFKEDKQTTHIASPPGFLSATNIEALNDQLDYIALNYNKKNAASAFLQYRGHDVKSEISNLLSKIYRIFWMVKVASNCIGFDFQTKIQLFCVQMYSKVQCELKMVTYNRKYIIHLLCIFPIHYPSHHYGYFL